ncbi:RNA-binding ribosome biosynthesis protein mak21 [Diaporthe australafricana]|uniref:RNA-binding ribosome biosynthesis protein mak21 n=1 Tax=Diaporthe australafricana TaxID=127596 RepID=A0ABR3WYK5_9PEZI
MGKKRTKAQNGAKPAFDETALSKLTAKIDTDLANPKSKSKPKDKKQKDERPAKRKRSENDVKDATPNKRQAQEPKNRPSKPLKKASKESKTPKDKRAELLQEILALGGDENDLDIVAGVDSDAEEGQESKPKEAPVESDKVLKNELAKFAAGLGFEKVRDEDAATDDEGEEEEVEEESEAADEEEDEWEDDSQQIAEEPPAEKQSRSAAGKLIFEPKPDWHTLSQDGLPSPSADDIRNYSSTINSLHEYAKTLLEADAAAYNTTVAASSTRKFMSTIMSSGTMSDKVSALTLAVQESPVHNVKALENLLNLAGKKSRDQAIAALGALVDLLGNGVVLPGDRRLRLFRTQPGLLGTLQKHSVTAWKPEKPLPGKITKAHLMMWAFEDWLKDTYFKIIQLLERWSGDEIEYTRHRSLDYVYGLLKEKPEQEANLLRLLVNKLGDRERKIASRASYLILQLLLIHPGMKTIVVSTVEQEALLRPGQTIRTKYYAIITLNQTILSNKEPQIADTLVRMYFDLFVALLKMGALGASGSPDAKTNQKATGANKQPVSKKAQATTAKVADVPDTETAEKLVSAILTGVNRAVPFCTADDETLESHLDTLFRITHSANFNTSIQALKLVQQLSVTKHIATDRFYRTLYESLLDPRLIHSSKQADYLNLLYRSLNSDIDVRRVKAFVKRMLQICFLHQPSFVCGILFLVAQLEDKFPDLKTLLNEPEEDGDDEEVYKDAPEGLSEDLTTAQDSQQKKSAYDGRKRDPQYSNADQSCLWEVVPYFKHFHPSVSVFAANLLVRQKVLPKPELANHTLMHFLDKFVYKNPKAADSKRGGSIMQPVLAAGSSAHVVVPGKSSVKQQPTVNSAAFWNMKQQDVAAEDVFFHTYFSQIGKSGQEDKGKKSKKATADGDDEEADEDEIWDALVNSRPEVAGEDEDDVDLDMGSDEDDDLGSLLEDMSEDDDDDDEDMDSGAEGVEFGDGDLPGEEDGWVNGADLVDGSDEEPAGKKGKDGKGRMRKRDFKKLPMFATADDYAALLEQEED